VGYKRQSFFRSKRKLKGWAPHRTLTLLLLVGKLLLPLKSLGAGWTKVLGLQSPRRSVETLRRMLRRIEWSKFSVIKLFSSRDQRSFSYLNRGAFFLLSKKNQIKFFAPKNAKNQPYCKSCSLFN
jgi:hypothetical protein